MKSAGPVDPEDFALYAGDLLESLQKMARGHDQILLAHLLALAVLEARSLAGSRRRVMARREPAQKIFQAQPTRLPG